MSNFERTLLEKRFAASGSSDVARRVVALELPAGGCVVRILDAEGDTLANEEPRRDRVREAFDSRCRDLKRDGYHELPAETPPSEEFPPADYRGPLLSGRGGM